MDLGEELLTLSCPAMLLSNQWDQLSENIRSHKVSEKCIYRKLLGLGRDKDKTEFLAASDPPSRRTYTS